MTEDEVVRVRTEGIREAAGRARLAFLASTLISLTIVSMAWNRYFSWYRQFALAPTSAVPATINDAPAAAADLRSEVVRNWIQSQWVTIGLLGVRVGAADACIAGSVAVLIVTLWFFFAVRRENHAIAHLLSDSRHESPETQRYVFYGIVSSLVFLSPSPDDQPRCRLADADNGRPAQPELLARGLFPVLIFLPVVALASLILADLLSLALPPPFRTDERSLFVVLSFERRLQAVVMMLMACGAALATAAFCRRIHAFEQATTEILREFALEVESVPNPAVRAAATRSAKLKQAFVSLFG